VRLADGSITGVETRRPAPDRRSSGFCETHRRGLLLAYFAPDAQSPGGPRAFYLQQGRLRIALDPDVKVVHQRKLGLSRLRVFAYGEEHQWSKYIGHLALFRRGYSWPIQEWDQYDFLRWVARVANDPQSRRELAAHFD
jgi:hypothetical protein